MHNAAVNLDQSDELLVRDRRASVAIDVHDHILEEIGYLQSSKQWLLCQIEPFENARPFKDLPLCPLGSAACQL